MEEETERFGQVAEIRSLAPNAEPQHDIDRLGGDGCLDGGGGGRLESGLDAQGGTPGHVVGENLGVEGDDRRPARVGPVTPVVGSQNEDVFGLVPDRRILESESCELSG